MKNVIIGKNICEILNNSIANKTLIGILADKECENLTSENYWEKVKIIANLVAEQKEKNGEIFYLTFYDIILKMTKKCIDKDKIYTQSDYEEFKEKMTEMFNISGVQMEFMTEIGLTPDKIFLKSISEVSNFKNRKEQTTALLEIARNNMDLGNLNNDLQNFTMNIYSVYEELVNGENQENLQEYINLLLESYYKTLKKTTDIELRKSEFIFTLENPNIKRILDNILLNREFYSNPNNVKNIFDKYPDFYKKTQGNKDFYKMVIKDLPEDKQKEYFIIDNDDLIEIIIGETEIEDITLDKLENIGDIAKFFVVYKTYCKLMRESGVDKAEEFWGKFYGRDENLGNNITRSLYDETLQVIESSPEEVNQSSMERITTKFMNEMLKTNENQMEKK